MFADLEKALTGQLSSWDQIKSNDVAALNTQLKQAGLPPIDLAKLVSSTGEAVQTTAQNKDKNEE
jgi:hypothetical protein